MATPTQPRQHIGVAFSGGGHRAALFALGALLYLVDADKAPQVAAVTSCSGGSLTNAYSGLGDLRTESPTSFRERMRPLARACATTGTLFAGGITYTYLGVVGIVTLVGLINAFVLGGWWAPLLVLATLAVVGGLLMFRGWLPEITFDQTLFHGAPLKRLNSGIDHVVCATDLQTCEHVYFSGTWVRSYRLGIGRPDPVSLSRAVQSSAAFPGGFYPRRLSIKAMGFPRPHVISSMLLSDGGVYDNMATEWFTGGRPDDPPSRQADELVVINASAAPDIVRRPLLRIPVVGEFAELMAVLMTTYDQTTAVRRRWLYSSFTEGERRGAIIQIDRPATELPRSFAEVDDEKGTRARAVLTMLDEYGSDTWATDAAASAAIPTNLSALGAEASARLVRHAYALTMANTHVLLDYPLRPIPTLADLESWMQ